jgi:hypothetical protein
MKNLARANTAAVENSPNQTGIATIIDLEDPEDSAPALEHVVKLIERVKQENSDKHVIVLLGENHAVPLHHVFQHVVCQSLIAKSLTTTIAYEHPHNSLQPCKPFNDIELQIDNTLNHIKLNSPADYQKLQRMDLARKTNFFADVTSHLIKDVELENSDLSIIFADLAERKLILEEISYLDQSDPFTSTIFEEHHNSRHAFIEVASPEGVKLRNIGMLKAIRQVTFNEVTVLKTGLVHMYGNVCEGKEYKDSLYQLIKADSNCVVIPVLFETQYHSLETLCDKNIRENILNDPNVVLVRGGDDSIYINHELRNDAKDEFIKLKILFSKHGISWPQHIQSIADIEKSKLEKQTNLIHELIRMSPQPFFV